MWILIEPVCCYQVILVPTEYGHEGQISLLRDVSDDAGTNGAATLAAFP